MQFSLHIFCLRCNIQYEVYSVSKILQAIKIKKEIMAIFVIYLTDLIKALLFGNIIPEHFYVFTLSWYELK